VTTYFFDTDIEEEAYYLSSVLNSHILDNMIKPLQAAGSFGQRHIHKLPLTFPIPKYDEANPIHKELAEISSKCHKKVEEIIHTLDLKSTGKIRSMIRKLLGEEYQIIDKDVKMILK